MKLIFLFFFLLLVLSQQGLQEHKQSGKKAFRKQFQKLLQASNQMGDKNYIFLQLKQDLEELNADLEKSQKEEEEIKMKKLKEQRIKEEQEKKQKILLQNKAKALEEKNRKLEQQVKQSKINQEGNYENQKKMSELAQKQNQFYLNEMKNMANQIQDMEGEKEEEDLQNETMEQEKTFEKSIEDSMKRTLELQQKESEKMDQIDKLKLQMQGLINATKFIIQKNHIIENKLFNIDIAITKVNEKRKEKSIKGKYVTELHDSEKNQCISLKNCQNCVQNSQCGWCQKDRKCIPGDVVGPYEGTCSSYSYSNCHQDQCSLNKKCKDCIKNQNCGWCESHNQCVEGNPQQNLESCKSGFVHILSGNACIEDKENDLIQKLNEQ